MSAALAGSFPAAGNDGRFARAFAAALIVRPSNQLTAKRIIFIQLQAFFFIFAAQTTVLVRRHLKRIGKFTFALRFYTGSRCFISEVFSVRSRKNLFNIGQTG